MGKKGGKKKVSAKAPAPETAQSGPTTMSQTPSDASDAASKQPLASAPAEDKGDDHGEAVSEAVKVAVAKAMESAVADVQNTKGEGTEDAAASTPAVATNGAQGAGTASEKQQDHAGDEELSKLRAENKALKEQVQDLKDRLAAAEAKPQAQAVPNLSTAGGDGDALSPLQDRLQQLKQQQREADERRDQAWKALKQVIEEVSNLASTARTPAVAPTVN